MFPAGIVALGRGQKVARDELGALVDQLVEGVLAVGAGQKLSRQQTDQLIPLSKPDSRDPRLAHCAV